MKAASSTAATLPRLSAAPTTPTWETSSRESTLSHKTSSIKALPRE